MQDTSKDKKKDDKKDVKISAVGMEDEYGGRIIELVMDSDGEYDILWLVEVDSYIGLHE